MTTILLQGNPTCKPCAARARAAADSKYLCARCNHIIDTEHLTFKVKCGLDSALLINLNPMYYNNTELTPNCEHAAYSEFE